MNPSKIFALHALATTLCSAQSITGVTTTFQGSSVPIGGAGVFQYDLSASIPTSIANTSSFQSHLRFYTKFTATGGLAQLFRRNIDYSISFQVNDPLMIGYKIKVRKQVKGISSIKWTGPTGDRSSTGSVNYKSGLIYVNNVLKTALGTGNFVGRQVSEVDPNPSNVTHQVERNLTLTGYRGDQIFTISENEPATQISNVFQNYNTGSAELLFGIAPSVTGYTLTTDDSGDVYHVTVVFNPTCSFVPAMDGSVRIAYSGVLQQSDDMVSWIDLSPQPASPYLINSSTGRRFYRARSIE